MKKIFLLLSVITLVGCGAGNGIDSVDLSQVDKNDDLPIESNCILGEIYSLDALAFDICSTEIVTVGPVEGSLNMVKLDNQTIGYLVEGDYEDGRISVDRDELILSLENGLFGGVTSIDEEGYGANYVDLAGVEGLELDFLGANQGYKNYFALVDGDLLKFDDNFNAVAFLSGVISR